MAIKEGFQGGNVPASVAPLAQAEDDIAEMRQHAARCDGADDVERIAENELPSACKFNRRYFAQECRRVRNDWLEEATIVVRPLDMDCLQPHEGAVWSGEELIVHVSECNALLQLILRIGVPVHRLDERQHLAPDCLHGRKLRRKIALDEKLLQESCDDIVLL